MDTLSASATKELVEASHVQYHALLKKMAPSRFHSWDWASDEFKEGAEWIRNHPHEIHTGLYLSDTPNKEVWRITIPDNHGGGEVVIKIYTEPTLSWFSVGKRSIAVQEILNYAAMEGLGIPVAKPLSCGEVRRLGRLKSSYIVTRFINNSIDGSALMPTGYLTEDKVLKMAFCRKALEIIARAHVCAVASMLDGSMKAGYEVFNVGTGRPVSVLELVNAFEKVNGLKLNYRFAPRRPGDVTAIWADPTLANTEMGWKATRTVEETLKAAWAWECHLAGK